MAEKIKRMAGRKKYGEQNVYDAALDRIRYCYKKFDNVLVSFSGGKDSTAVLNLAITVARELGRLPVRAIFFDEEAIHPPTIEYVERVRQNPDVALEWYCVELKHRNACSNDQPYWYCWDKTEQEKWVRPLPPHAITEHPKFKKGMSHDFFAKELVEQEDGSTCVMTGIRTQESMRRFVACSRKEEDNYITALEAGKAAQAHPIYDWSSVDVWVLINKMGYDYNKTYDIFNRTKKSNNFLSQRVCPPFGEEPLRQLWIYAECFPELWHKMLYRVRGVATAWRYSNTDLYGIGTMDKPDGMTWKEYCKMALDSYQPKTRKALSAYINSIIKRHYDKSNDPILEEEISPVTGVCWKYLAKIAIKGDFKERSRPIAIGAAVKECKKKGITFETAVEFYANNKFKDKVK